MAKLALKNAPVSFPLTVEIPTPTGTGDVTLTAKHLPATVWAKMRDAHGKAIEEKVKEIMDAARAEAEAAYAAAHADDKPKKGAAKQTADEIEAAEVAKETAILALAKPMSQEEFSALRASMSAKLITEIASGWDLDDEFTELAIAEMCDLYQGAASAVLDAYNQKLEGKRVKN